MIYKRIHITYIQLLIHTNLPSIKFSDLIRGDSTFGGEEGTHAIQLS
jgi:hypothetical protein